MSAPTLSVVVPSYNLARFLPATLESLVSQAQDALEILVVDDGSTDGTDAVVEGFARREKKVRLIRHERNRGLAAAWNTGVGEARGEYVIVPGADDPAMPGLLSKSREMLGRHPGAGVCSARSRLMSEDGKDLGPYYTPEISREPRFISPDELLPLYKRHGSWLVTRTMVYHREGALELGGWDPALAPACDGVLALHLIARRGACYLPDELAYWRLRGQSVASAMSADTAELLAYYDRITRALQSPRSGPGLPQELVAEHDRRTLLVGLSEALAAPALRVDQVRALIERLPRRGFPESLALAALPDPKLARWAVKMLLFSHEPAREKCRLAARAVKRRLPSAAR